MTDSLASNLSPNGGRAEQQRAGARRRAWLASLLMRRESSALSRLAACVERLRRAPRPWRRRLRRQLAATLTGAALLLAMSGVHAQADPLAPAATINVVNGQVAVAANGQCSLIEAIDNANKTTATGQHADCAAGNPTGADTIVLPNNGDFILTTVNNTTWKTGLPPLTSTITINGNGSTIRRGAAAPQMGILGQEGGDVTLNNVTIENGLSPSSSGGGILVTGGNLTLNNSRIRNNSAADGGGIACFGDYVGAQLTVTNSEITGNVASHPTAGRGGGLVVVCPATISGSTISGNHADGGGGGVHVFSYNVYITNTTISDNDAKRGGGLDVSGAAIIDHSTISGNFAQQDGGGVFVRGNAVVGIVNSTLSGNGANYGGGLELVGAASGSQTVTVTNSTVTDNFASFFGGGVTVFGGSLDLNHSLIAGNRDIDSYAGYVHEVYAASGSTITAGNRNLFGHAGLSNAQAFAGFLPSGTDINATSNGTAPTPLANILSPLANNGGPTQTHALPAGSPALDVAPNAACNATPILGQDQRGLARNQNGKGSATTNECDIGAFEAQGAPAPSPSLYVSPAAAGTAGNIAATPQDILFRDGAANTWAVHFDGSDVGVTKPIAAFARLANGDLLLALKAGQSLPGVGAITPWDVVRFTPTSLGNDTDGTFSWYIDGSDVGLTTTAEKIDALDVLPDGRVLVSTVGALAAPKLGGGTLKVQDEDLAAFTPTALGATTTGAWSLYFNGTAIPGMGVEDVAGAHVDPATGHIYVAITGAFNIGGVSGNGKDVLKLTPSGSSYTVALYWRGGNHGFNLNLGGFELP